MPAERTDLTVFARDYPEARLLVEVKTTVSTPPEKDSTIWRLSRSMWGANCHYGLVITPETTYVLRDDFRGQGPDAIRVTNLIPTSKLFSRIVSGVWSSTSEQELELLAGEWLHRLAADYQSALPDDPDVLQAFFPDIVGAINEGRVVPEVAA